MGADHAHRLAERTSGATVTVVHDADLARAETVATEISGARVATDAFSAIADPDVDAVLLASPAPAHYEQVLACLAANKPVLCEKPLTTAAATALDVVRRESALGTPLVQVGFMRRFDDEYVQLHKLIAAGDLGTPLLIHCAHRNPSVPTYFDSEMLIKDCLVHEVDATRFLLGEEVTAVTVLRPTPNPSAPAGLQDPQLVILETANGRIVDVELFVTSGRSYEVRAEVIGESGSATAGFGRRSADFLEHFVQAYDAELQSWIDAVRAGRNVDGPGAWDGYMAAAVCTAGVESLRTGQRVAVASH
ncbi:Gfo/Idh/MocA family oxidoreductase [Antrihabitans sp. YC2-6]|nr:Gfo/Idh/MocA family oxidoreductase [Antrihabitans sp. YC2-6]